MTWMQWTLVFIFIGNTRKYSECRIRLQDNRLEQRMKEMCCRLWHYADHLCWFCAVLVIMMMRMMTLFCWYRSLNDDDLLLLIDSVHPPEAYCIFTPISIKKFKCPPISTKFINLIRFSFNLRFFFPLIWPYCRRRLVGPNDVGMFRWWHWQ